MGVNSAFCKDVDCDALSPTGLENAQIREWFRARLCLFMKRNAKVPLAANLELSPRL
jgi:hypothetical protein